MADTGARSASASPSAWSKRLPVAVLALVGLGIATYLTLYQWHVTHSVWDPFFGARGSERVLTSAIERYLPLPDATLGAMAYAVEAVLAVIGGTERHREHPKVVLLLGLVAAGMALTGLALVLTQIFFVHAGCTLCIGSAVISWINAALTREEALAAWRAPDRPEAVTGPASRNGLLTDEARRQQHARQIDG